MDVKALGASLHAAAWRGGCRHAREGLRALVCMHVHAQTFACKCEQAHKRMPWARVLAGVFRKRCAGEHARMHTCTRAGTRGRGGTHARVREAIFSDPDHCFPACALRRSILKLASCAGDGVVRVQPFHARVRRPATRAEVFLYERARLVLGPEGALGAGQGGLGVVSGHRIP